VREVRRLERGGGGGESAVAATRSAESWLPRGHVGRTRLVEVLVGPRVGIIVGGSGWGKTTLSLELAATLECRTAAVRLTAAADTASLRTALRRACRRAGLSACTAALDSTADAGAALDALVDALADDPSPVLVIVDEIEHADGLAFDALAAFAGDLPAPHRALLVGRAAPAALRTALDGVPTALIEARDLAFTKEETIELGGTVGIDLAEPVAGGLVETTGGWAAALTVALERIRLGDDGVLGRPDRPGVLGELVRELLDGLDAGAAATVVQLAHLVPLPVASIDDVTGGEGVVDLALRAGIPLDVRRDGWLDLSGPVREALVAVHAVDRACARRAADLHRALGEPLQGTRLLIGARDVEGAAATLAALTPGQVAGLDFHELHTLVTAVGPAVEAYPRALLHLARSCEAAAEARVRDDALARAERAAAGDGALEREIVAERARDLVRDGRTEEAALLAEGLIASAGLDELQTRVRALHVLGRTYAWKTDLRSLAAAEPLLLEAAELYVALGDPNGAAHALLGLAYDVYTLGGRVDDAVDCLARAAALLPPRARLRAVLLDFQGEALVDVGRDVEADVVLVEADRLGRLLGDARAVAYSAWVRARVAARRGDAAATRALLAAAEESRGDWFDHHTGVEFLAESAVLLDQVGLGAAAEEALGRARVRREEAPRYVLLAEGMIAARSGDPALGEALLGDALERTDLESRLRWRATLLRAWSAHRAGSTDGGAALTGRAFALAAALGHPELPSLWEPAITASLTADPGESEPGPVASVVRVRALGGFAVERDGIELELPAGRPTALVALLAATGGRITSDEAIEALWPGVDPPSGRKRLRNVLNRLRETAGDVVIRDGQSLSLGAQTEIDAVLFEQAAERALGDTGTEAEGLTRAALARYTGDLLPDSRYEDWAAAPRERLKFRALKLVDRLAAVAERDGELDDALEYLERGIELDVLDEARFLRAARVLLSQGRRGRALDVLRRSAGALRGLGLEPSEEHRALVRAARG
jgi:DNA-binding SARP family transcriptional activator